MRGITSRLEKLEKVFVPAVAEDTRWGSMVGFRDTLLRQAAGQGARAVGELSEHLETPGPTGLWLEVAREHLKDRSFVQEPQESFAMTMARALGIGVRELVVLIQEGSIGTALVERFQGAG